MKSDPVLITFFVIFSALGCGEKAPNDTPDVRDLPDGSTDARIFRDSTSEVGPSDAAGDADPGGPLVLPAQFTEENMPLRMLREGDSIDLWAAPQGGHVVLVGAKVKNFAADTAILRVRVRYPDTPFIIAEEARSVKFVPIPGEPDTKQPELETRTQVAHVPLCPDYDPMDIVDAPLEFSVTVTSQGDAAQTAQTTLRLSPSCKASAEGETFCRCECSANYVLGKCPRDAGRD
ncbi:MAG: hypothetical protein ABW133_01290 [Polyangiaceae bacterium]